MKIKDLLSATIDNRGKTPPVAHDGYCLLEINCIAGKDKYPDYSQIKKHVDKETFLTWFRSGHPKVGDILIPTVGTLDAVSVMDRNDCCIAQNLVAIRANPEVCDSEYLYYLLCYPQVRQRLLQLDIGAVQPSIKVPHLKELEVNVPPLDVQKKIASILTNIDSKIKINSQINNNLEQQAQAIFDAWFVDFLPFDGALPAEWSSTTLGNVCLCELGGTPSRSRVDFWNGDVPWINSGEVNRFRITTPSEYITRLGVSKSATKLLPAKTTVLAITGATLGQVSLLEIAACTNQSVVGIVPNQTLPYEFIYPFIKSRIQELISHQTGGAQQHINKQNVEGLPVFVPSTDTMEQYVSIVEGLYAAIANNCFENERLVSLRDSLLPRLMSGDLDVSAINL